MSRWTTLLETDYAGMHVFIGFEPFRLLYDKEAVLSGVPRLARLWTRLVIVDLPNPRCAHVNTLGDLEKLVRAQLHEFGDNTSLFYVGDAPGGPLRVFPSPGPYSGAIRLPTDFVAGIRQRGGRLDAELPARLS